MYELVEKIVFACEGVNEPYYSAVRYLDIGGDNTEYQIWMDLISATQEVINIYLKSYDMILDLFAEGQFVGSSKSIVEVNIILKNCTFSEDALKRRLIDSLINPKIKLSVYTFEEDYVFLKEFPHFLVSSPSSICINYAKGERNSTVALSAGDEKYSELMMKTFSDCLNMKLKKII